MAYGNMLYIRLASIPPYNLAFAFPSSASASS
jgi:hypothetical protein